MGATGLEPMTTCCVRQALYQLSYTPSYFLQSYYCFSDFITNVYASFLIIFFVCKFTF